MKITNKNLLTILSGAILFITLTESLCAELIVSSFGGIKGETEITDSIKLSDQTILICGMLGDIENLPKNIKPQHILSDSFKNDNYAFVANFAKDLSDIKFFYIFPADLISPSKLIQTPSGELYLAGITNNQGALESLKEFAAEKKGRQGKAVLAKLDLTKKTFEWIIKAGPNMEIVTGMAATKDSKILYTGSTSVKGAAMYVLKVNNKGQSEDFAKAKKNNGTFEKSWAIYLNESGNEQLKEKYYNFYRKGGNEGYDYDGPSGKWGQVRFWDISPRIGGQIVLLPDDDFIVSAGIYFKFKEGNNKAYPAFNLLLARFSKDGELHWATNLYQENDSIHTPDQKPRDICVDPKGNTVYLLVSQHGSNIYRLKGDLRGDTGNMLINWVGKIDAKTGNLQEGWYFMNNRHGKYDPDGFPSHSPHPKLAGNALNQISVGPDGNVYLAGTGAAKMWTSKDAFQHWPEDLAGGGFPCLVVLSPDLKKHHFASVFMGDHTVPNSGGTINSFEFQDNAIYMFGTLSGKNFQKGAQFNWSTKEGETKNALIIKIQNFKVKK